jgi:hypothetical protein
MTTCVINKAVLQLLWLQSRGRRRRMWQRFCEPRRLALSALACALAILWLGNAAMTVWLRETASQETLRALLSLGLVLYAGWHLAKAAFFPPANPFDWAPAEYELLAAMPLRPRELVAYQLASVTVTTCLKAGLFTILLLPDLRCVPLGLVGVLAAMMMLELIRMTIDIATWGMGRAAWLVYRAAVAAGLLGAGFVVVTVIAGEDGLGGRINLGEGLLQRILDILVRLDASALGYGTAPFQPFVDLVVADAVSTRNAWTAAAACGLVTVLGALVVGLYAAIGRHIAKREKLAYNAARALYYLAADSLQNKPALPQNAGLALRLRRIPRWGGAGALAWRQLVSARRQWGSLVTAMIAPAILASAPCFVIADRDVAFLATTGTVAFYTFLLLPTAVRFDFRRDLDRLATFKSLPITAAAAAIGQTLAPVLMATAFQSLILAFAAAARSLSLYHFFVTMLVMIPLNVLVFGFDNLIYLLYPYRLQQEGFEIFLRTILTFTGKGLVFAAGLAGLSAWGVTAAALTNGLSHWTGIAVNAYATFTAGVIAGLSLLAAITLYGLSRAYQWLKPAEDLPR